MSDTMFAQHTGINPQDGRVAYGDDSRLTVRFFRGTQRHGIMSEEQSRPVMVGVDMIAIRQPGERDEYHGVASAEHKMRFPKQWEAYQNNQEFIPDGTPLAVLYPNAPETVENLRFMKIYTVEQLAGLQEAAIGRIGMGGRDHVTRAQKFMQAATGFQAASVMNKEMTDLKDENDLLKQRLEALEKLMTAASEDQPRRGPGRPPKTQESPE